MHGEALGTILVPPITPDFTKAMANAMRLQPRDLRTVELNQNQFGIYARRNSILINMLVCHCSYRLCAAQPVLRATDVGCLLLRYHGCLVGMVDEPGPVHAA